jgi:hypothetical protein
LKICPRNIRKTILSDQRMFEEEIEEFEAYFLRKKEEGG